MFLNLPLKKTKQKTLPLDIKAETKSERRWHLTANSEGVFSM